MTRPGPDDVRAGAASPAAPPLAALAAAPGAPISLDLEDVEAVRLLLAGGSVLDWHKAAFASHTAVDRFLGLHDIRLDRPEDRQRLRFLLNEAVSYLEDHLGLRIEPELRSPEDVRDVFLWASDARGYRRRQATCCMILKVMHVISHLEAVELKSRVGVAELQLLDVTDALVRARVTRLREQGAPISRFEGNRKTRTSVVSKLLAKRDDVASKVFDKLRYRLVVPREEDLAPMLALLTRHLFPYSQVVPGQSHNTLLDPERVEALLPPEVREALQRIDDTPVRAERSRNEFSGDTYRVINVVADVPVPLPEALRPPGDPARLGRTVYGVVELQIVDEATARRNEEGDNAHELYKRRQFQRVSRRLLRGTLEG